ncbi:MAG: rhomboid family intramembrane serine protease, partial [Cumulibacter sp.]
ALFLMLIATAWTWWGDPGAIAKWGFVPLDPLRHGGLTLLTSFFLHTGWLHLLGNAVFLLVFGDNVEDYLGHFRFLLLLLGASLAGDLVHMTWEARAALPVVGASAGISGVIAFYALQFPKARLVYFVRAGFVMRWVRFSALSGFLFWCLLQGAEVWMQVNGHSYVSALAHLGGAVFGLFWWYSSRRQSQKTNDPFSLS